ncbi:hypothetical protein ACLEX4_21105 [Pseudescherichia vulneris]
MSTNFGISFSNWKRNLIGAPVSLDDAELMAQITKMDEALSNWPCGSEAAI